MTVIVSGLYRTLLINCIFISFASACECLWQGSFSKSFNKADFIVSGTVVASKGNSIDFSIDQTFLDKQIGGKEFLSTVRVWTDDGKQCRPEVNLFPVNSQWVFALNKITEEVDGGFNPNTPNISYGRKNDYYLSKCGANWLQVQEGYATGNLINGRRWEWENEEMNPVLVPLIDAYVKGIIPQQALVEAAKPLSETKKMMEQTKQFIQQQE